MRFHVHILSNRPRGTLYVGVTRDLRRRVMQHKLGLLDGFTKTYGLKLLVYYEGYQRSSEAIHREKRLKHWNRAWKLDPIESTNPGWEDLNTMFV